MDKCSSVEMRKNLRVADYLRKQGIDFVCVPVLNKQNKDELAIQSQEAFNKIMEEVAGK